MIKKTKSYIYYILLCLVFYTISLGFFQFSYGDSTGKIYFYPNEHSYKYGCFTGYFVSDMLISATTSGFHNFQAEFYQSTIVTGAFGREGRHPQIRELALNTQKTQIIGDVGPYDRSNLIGPAIPIGKLYLTPTSNITGIFIFDLARDLTSTSPTKISHTPQEQICIPTLGCSTISGTPIVISTIPQGDVTITPIIQGPCYPDDAYPTITDRINVPHLSGSTKQINDRNYIFTIQDAGGIVISDMGFVQDPNGKDIERQMANFVYGIDNESGIDPNTIIFSISIGSNTTIFQNNDTRLNLSGINRTRDRKYRDYVVYINSYDLPDFGTGTMLEENVIIDIFAQDYSGKQITYSSQFNQGLDPNHINTSICDPIIVGGQRYFSGISATIEDDRSGIDLDSIKLYFNSPLGNNVIAYGNHDLNIIENNIDLTSINIDYVGITNFVLGENATGTIILEYSDNVGKTNSGILCQYTPEFNALAPQVYIDTYLEKIITGALLGPIYFDIRNEAIGIDINTLEINVIGYVGQIGKYAKPLDTTIYQFYSGDLNQINQYHIGGQIYNYTGILDINTIFYPEENITVSISGSDYMGQKVNNTITLIGHKQNGIINIDHKGYHNSGAGVGLDPIEFTVSDHRAGVDMESIVITILGKVNGINETTIHSGLDLNLNEFININNYGYTGILYVPTTFDIINNISITIQAEKKIGGGFVHYTENISLNLTNSLPTINIISNHVDGTNQGLYVSGGIMIDEIYFSITDDWGIEENNISMIIHGYINGNLDTTVINSGELNLNNFFYGTHSLNYNGSYIPTKKYDAGQNIIIIIQVEDIFYLSNTLHTYLIMPGSIPEINILTDHGGNNGRVKNNSGSLLTELIFETKDLIGIKPETINILITGTKNNSYIQYIISSNQLNFIEINAYGHTNNYLVDFEYINDIGEYFDPETNIYINISVRNYSHNLITSQRIIYDMYQNPNVQITSIHNQGGTFGYQNTINGILLDPIEFITEDDRAIDFLSTKLTIRGYQNGILNDIVINHEDLNLTSVYHNGHNYNYSGSYYDSNLFFDIGSFVSIVVESKDLSNTNIVTSDSTILGIPPQPPTITITSMHKNEGNTGRTKSIEGAKLQNIYFYIEDEQFVDPNSIKLSLSGYVGGNHVVYNFFSGNLNLSLLGNGSYEGYLDINNNAIFTGYFDHEKNIDIKLEAKNLAGLWGIPENLKIYDYFVEPNITITSSHDIGGENGFIRSELGAILIPIEFNIRDDRAINHNSIILTISGIQNGMNTVVTSNYGDLNVVQNSTEYIELIGTYTDYRDAYTDIHIEIYVEDMSGKSKKINRTLTSSPTNPTIYLDSIHNLGGNVGWIRSDQGSKLENILFRVEDERAVKSGSIEVRLIGYVSGILQTYNYKYPNLELNNYLWGTEEHIYNYSGKLDHNNNGLFTGFFDPETDINISIRAKNIGEIYADPINRTLNDFYNNPIIKITSSHNLGNETLIYAIGDGDGRIKTSSGYLLKSIDFELTDDWAGIDITKTELQISGFIIDEIGNIILTGRKYLGNDSNDPLELIKFTTNNLDTTVENNFYGTFVQTGNKSKYTGYFAYGYPITINITTQDYTNKTTTITRILDYDTQPFFDVENFSISTINYLNPYFEQLKILFDGDNVPIDKNSIEINIQGKKWGQDINITLTGPNLFYSDFFSGSLTGEITPSTIEGIINHNLYFDYWYECNRGFCNNVDDYDGYYNIQIKARDIMGNDLLYNGNNLGEIGGKTEKLQCEYLHRCNEILYLITGRNEPITEKSIFTGSQLLIVGSGVQINKSNKEIICNDGIIQSSNNIYINGISTIYNYEEIEIIGGEFELLGDTLTITQGR